MREIHTEIEIKARAGRVWQVLTDFALYPEWNPFIHRLEGEPVANSRLRALIQPPGGKLMTFRPIVLVAEPDRELRWRGQLWVPRVFDGEHSFVIEARGNERVRFIQRERFSGLLVPFVWSALNRDVRRGFEAMNREAALRCESTERGVVPGSTPRDPEEPR